MEVPSESRQEEALSEFIPEYWESNWSNDLLAIVSKDGTTCMQYLWAVGHQNPARLWFDCWDASYPRTVRGPQFSPCSDNDYVGFDDGWSQVTILHIVGRSVTEVGTIAVETFLDGWPLVTQYHSFAIGPRASRFAVIGARQRFQLPPPKEITKLQSIRDTKNERIIDLLLLPWGVESLYVSYAADGKSLFLCFLDEIDDVKTLSVTEYDLTTARGKRQLFQGNVVSFNPRCAISPREVLAGNDLPALAALDVVFYKEGEKILGFLWRRKRKTVRYVFSVGDSVRTTPKGVKLRGRYHLKPGFLWKGFMLFVDVHDGKLYQYDNRGRNLVWCATFDTLAIVQLPGYPNVTVVGLNLGKLIFLDSVSGGKFTFVDLVIEETMTQITSM